VDDRSAIFLQVMIAIAIIGVLAFLASLVVRRVRRAQAGDGAGDVADSQPPWYEFVLGLLLLIVVTALVVWQVTVGNLWTWGETTSDWGSDTRAIVFMIVMAIAAVAGLLVFFIHAIARSPGRQTSASPATAPDDAPAVPDSAAPAAAVRTPSATRLIGLLLLAVAFLLLCAVYLPRETQHQMMMQLMYPASLAVAMVLLFDKASRTWNAKSGAEVVREWLFCDALVFLLFLGFLNLRSLDAPAEYANVFWDVLALALFFVVFWLLDRKVTRFRFLVVYGYFIALPLLLLIWRTVQGLESPEGLSWWSTIWPFLILSILFFILEIVALVADRGAGKHALPAVKDAVFLALYGVLLIIAIPEAAT